MCNKYFSVFYDHLRHVQNDITNTYNGIIPKYTDRVWKILELDIYLYPPINMGEEYRKADYKYRDETFIEWTTRKVIKDGLPNVTHKDIDYKETDYCSI